MLISLAAWPARAANAPVEPEVRARNSPEAAADLCRFARRGDAESQYELAFLYAHGKGSERHDEWEIGRAHV